MATVGRKHGRGADEIIAECQQELGPYLTAVRQREIDTLPKVIWKGRTLYTIRCRGISGRGPHNVNVPVMLLWSLIWLERYVCPYHAGDLLLLPFPWEVLPEPDQEWPT